MLYAGVEDAVASAARLVSAARVAGVPVVFTRVEYQPDGSDGGLFFRKVPALASFVRGNPLGDFLDDPRPVDGDVVVTKQYASAFFGTSLASTLTAMGADTTVICRPVDERLRARHGARRAPARLRALRRRRRVR